MMDKNNSTKATASANNKNENKDKDKNNVAFEQEECMQKVTKLLKPMMLDLRNEESSDRDDTRNTTTAMPSITTRSLCEAYDDLLRVFQLEDYQTSCIDRYILYRRNQYITSTTATTANGDDNSYNNITSGDTDDNSIDNKEDCYYSENEKKQMVKMKERMILQADLLRATLIITQSLLVRLVKGDQLDEEDEDEDDYVSLGGEDRATMPTIKSMLETSTKRATALLQVLTVIYSDIVTPSDDAIGSDLVDSNLVPSKYHILKNLIRDYDEQQQQILENQGCSISLSLDKEQLESEEKELLLMASTPTPQEFEHNNDSYCHAGNYRPPGKLRTKVNSSLQAQIRLNNSSSTMQPIILDNHGMFRICHQDKKLTVPMTSMTDGKISSNRNEASWLITSKTTTSVKQTSLEVTNVLEISKTQCRTSNSCTSINLNLGTNKTQVRAWMDRIATIVNRLKSRKATQSKLYAAWESEQVQERTKQAKHLLHQC